MTPKLKVEVVPIETVKPYEHNAKLHPAEQVEQIARSIDSFGFNDPIAIDGDGTIIEGHGRLLAAQALHMDKVPVIRLTHLDDDARRAYILAHNKLTMNSGFDMDTLAAELDDIFSIDMSEFGFDDILDDDEAEDVETVIIEDEAPQRAPERVKLGDVWQLGRHRLMCGDCTDAESVAVLMDGNRADVCFTSPPYNMNAGNIGNLVKLDRLYLKGGGQAYHEYSDDADDASYSSLLTQSLANALRVCDDALFNIGILAGSKVGIVSMLSEFADKFCDVIVWDKGLAMPLGLPNQRALLSYPCELIFCFNQSGTRAFSHPQWDLGKGENVIRTAGSQDNEFANEHHATFPVAFAAKVVDGFTESSVLDLFGGTGTTLIAAEQCGRTCYMMELDPHYCDIILTRWEKLTGGTAERLTD
jgi:site-specific DNA-methyltransferase (adenine-specific)